MLDHFESHSMRTTCWLGSSLQRATSANVPPSFLNGLVGDFGHRSYSLSRGEVPLRPHANRPLLTGFHQASAEGEPSAVARCPRRVRSGAS